MIFNEYPRPQFQRDRWMNLNGEWNFEINKSSRRPMAYGSKIIVPYSPECKMSRVNRTVADSDYIYYQKTIIIPEDYSGNRILLHFGAVDYETVVWVNDAEVVRHCGGYLPFSADITDAIIESNANIVVQVRDSSDKSYHSRGKQKLKRGGIWYTPQSGIWQSVWIEPVPYSYINSVKITPDYDNATVSFSADVIGDEKAYVEFENEKYCLPAVIKLDTFEAWTPDNPKLYDITFTCGIDSAKSYFAMRKISVDKDINGIPRVMLNNKVCFQNGLLDQGYWQDGLYTPPSDEAMINDIMMAKNMGFNVLRKHIKVEPLRWYYHCDRLGMIVWQDFINGGRQYNPVCIVLPLFLGFNIKDNKYAFFSRKDEIGRKEFEEEAVEIVNHLYNSPCICLWTIFNEGWGQFDSAQIYQKIKSVDSTRLIDHASGWHDQGIGDIVTKHVYFKKYTFKPDKYGRCVLLSEFGGYNLKIEGHCFNNKNFGYKGYKSPEQLTDAIKSLFNDQIAPAREKGLSGAIYTQISDVEDELNGLVTYDRKVIKIPKETVKSIISI